MKKETRVYKVTDQLSLEADVYYRGSRSPVLLYIHSGALIFGSRRWFPAEQIEYYFRAGFSIVNIDYRLAPETGFEHVVEDVRDALEWVRTAAIERYDFDTGRIAVMGSSAGGYLSLLLGTMDWKPRAIVSFYGYGDILGEWYAAPSEHYRKRNIVSKEEAYRSVGDRELTDGQMGRLPFYIYCRQHGVWVREVTGCEPVVDRQRLLPYNPIDQVTSAFPPTLFLHGDRDTDVPFEQSVLMHDRLKAHGVPTELIRMEGADHVFDERFDDPAVQEALHSVVRFLQVYLR
ncbi:alpha/beta hydrolase [Cohnella sp. AR92]|uniref:alpha/beta hydrolase n=1 Tax=Cohnella sp. AR92 TaxID=648716 RepID=UPI000F8EF4D7|nr:alpha/beta hydrolase [Cohnella sp. AR92]RUS46042.1 alpha/beta hydrolase [Cohnella sp. AR92]